MAGIIGQRKLKGGEAVRMKKKPVGVERDQAESDMTFNLIKQLFPRCTNIFSGAVIKCSDLSVRTEQTEECVRSQPKCFS